MHKLLSVMKRFTKLMLYVKMRWCVGGPGHSGILNQKGEKEEEENPKEEKKMSTVKKKLVDNRTLKV